MAWHDSPTGCIVYNSNLGELSAERAAAKRELRETTEAIMAGDEDITGPHKICVEVRQRSMPQSGHITARASPGNIEEVLGKGDGFLVTRLSPYEELMVRVTL